MTSRFWIARLFILSALLPLLAACQSVPDRYSFWQSNPPSAASDKKPNLGNIPAAPAVADSKAEMEAMRQRLESDRLNALRSAQGLAPLPTAEAPAMANTNVAGASEMAPAIVATQRLAAPVQQPVMDNVVDYNYAGYAAPVAQSGPNALRQGNVQYNYAPGNNGYTYGYSAVQMQKNQASQQAGQIMADNPSVSIDLTALDNGSGAMTGLGTISGPYHAHGAGQSVAFFGHGSAQLNSKDRKTIQALAQKIKTEPVSMVLVGHASKRTGINDPVTSKAANLQMSAKRAATVLRELAKQGVDAKRVSVVAEGDHGAHSKKEATDRRVDLLFDK